MSLRADCEPDEMGSRHAVELIPGKFLWISPTINIFLGKSSAHVKDIVPKVGRGLPGCSSTRYDYPGNAPDWEDSIFSVLKKKSFWCR